jgi:AcrR family transcriptional regulator
VDAVLALVVEGHSIASLSIESIARRAGVAKATIYRRWSNLEELLIEAFASGRTIPDSIPMGSIRESLIAVLETVGNYGHHTAGRVFAALQADAQHNPGFRDRYFAWVIEPRRELLRQLLRQGIERGELRPDIDFEAVREVLIGPMLAHVKHRSFADPLDADMPRRIVDTVLQGIGSAKTLKRKG